MITESDRAQDLQGELVSWRPRKANGVVLVQRPASLRARKRQCFSLGLKEGKKNNVRVQRQSNGGILSYGGESYFLFYSDLQLIR